MSAFVHVCGDSAIASRYAVSSDGTARYRVAAELCIQGFLLLAHRIVPVFATPVGDRLQSSTEPLGDRFHVYCELPLSAAGADMRLSSPGEVPTSQSATAIAMETPLFADVLLDLDSTEKRWRGWAAVSSLILQSLVVGSLMVLPLMFTEALPNVSAGYVPLKAEGSR
jgi:hypothetical protein